jgi:hypothetical protein
MLLLLLPPLQHQQQLWMQMMTRAQQQQQHRYSLSLMAPVIAAQDVMFWHCLPQQQWLATQQQPQQCQQVRTPL